MMLNENVNQYNMANTVQQTKQNRQVLSRLTSSFFTIANAKLHNLTGYATAEHFASANQTAYAMFSFYTQLREYFVC